MQKTQKKTCSVPDCSFNTVAKGLCATHYQRKRRTGTTDDRVYQADHPCRVSDCETAANTKGYCRQHFGAYMRHGDPHVIINTQPAKEKKCCILDCGEPQRAKGVCHKHYYRALYHIRKNKINDHSEFIHAVNQRIHMRKEG